MPSLRTFLLVTTLICGMPAAQSYAAGQPPATAATEEKAPIKNDPKQTMELLELFGNVFERVRSDYVEEVADSDLIESAINGMLVSLDPHSSYMNNKSFKEMQIQTRGEFGGLGIEVTMDNGLVKVVSPIDDTPADKAGVMAGDYISQIDEEQVFGLTLSEAVEKMRGPVDSKVKITILRDGLDEPLVVELTRAVIKIKSVRAREEKDVGYIRITSFTEKTYDSMKDEAEKLLKNMPNAKGLVLDLRNNPGGLLDQAIAVADAFLERGEIVSTRERNPANTKRFNARPGDLLKGLPIVVLINGGSASASEIVAGALQDHKRAVVLGTKSFGKGSVQTVIPLPGHGAMRLTTSRYYTPSGHSIQAKGIEPDIMVEQAKIELLDKGAQRSEAALRGRLSNPEEKESPLVNKVIEDQKDKAKDKDKPKDKETKSRFKDELESKEDFQLSRAVDLLRALAVYKPQAAN